VIILDKLTTAYPVASIKKATPFLTKISWFNANVANIDFEEMTFWILAHY